MWRASSSRTYAQAFFVRSNLFPHGPDHMPRHGSFLPWVCLSSGPDQRQAQSRRLRPTRPPL
jgi:hypothetical protein